MSQDPVRLGEDPNAPSVLKDLLRDASVPALPDDVRGAVRAGLASASPGSDGGPPNEGGGPAPLTDPTPGDAAGAASGAGTVKALGLGSAALLLGAVLWVTTRPVPAPPPAATLQPAPSASVHILPSTAAPIVREAPKASAAPGVFPAAVVAPARPPSSRRASPPAASPSKGPPSLARSSAPSAAGQGDVDTLARESAMIARARGALARDPAASLQAAESHARAFPKGQLKVERDYLRVRALFRLGRKDEGRSRANALLKDHPSSPYAARVRTLVGDP